jgi:hypothetical protein
VHASDIPLSEFSVQLGACLSDDGNSIIFSGGHTGVAVFGPYYAVKPGIYSFLLDFAFAGREPPCAVVDVYGDGTVFASQEISTHSTRVRIQAYVAIECRLELRVYVEQTPFELKRVRFASGISHETAAISTYDRAELRQTCIELLGDQPIACAPTEWNEPGAVSDALFGDNQCQIIQLCRLENHEQTLRQVGISTPFISSFFSKHNGPAVKREPGDLLHGFPNIANSFQEEIAVTGTFAAPSPYDGKMVYAHDSIPVRCEHIMCILYEFRGQRPFIVGTSTGWCGGVSFIWLVKDDIIIHDSSWMHNWCDVENVISAYIAICARNHDRICVYRRERHKPAIISGFIRNMGHYFWNDVTGVERLARKNIGMNTKTIYSSSRYWLGTQEIFGDDGFQNVVNVQDWDELLGQMLSHREILVRPTGTQLDDPLAGKILRAARTRFATEDPGRWKAALETEATQSYILYVNLRAHNKAWTEQAQGIGFRI